MFPLRFRSVSVGWNEQGVGEPHEVSSLACSRRSDSGAFYFSLALHYLNAYDRLFLRKYTAKKEIFVNELNWAWFFVSKMCILLNMLSKE